MPPSHTILGGDFRRRNCKPDKEPVWDQRDATSRVEFALHPLYNMLRLTHPQLAYQYLVGRIRRDVEEFWAVALNADKEIISCQCLFRGTVDQCLFHPRDVFRFACLNNASAILIAHNHPSGNTRPSPQDIKITEQLLYIAALMQIAIVDHLIMGKDSYFSFLEAGQMKIKDPVWPYDP